MFPNHIVSCRQGALRGAYQDAVTAFLGVPFAQPPIGSLRWREPQEPAKWRGIRPADQYRAAPLQANGRVVDGLEQDFLSEDCLYLNIWTPASCEGEKLPVYVWYYGGSYQAGRGDDPCFCGQELAKRGIVVVTVNYRVNVFGFLCHPDMKKESPYGTGGNFGLLDQIASLKWLHENIAAFGGDPSRITIGGHSAGSASVNNLMVSPLSRDLIAGAINESGDVLQPERDVTFEQCCANGERLAEHFGVKTLDELRKIPAEAFIDLHHDLPGQLRIMCTPVIDGVVIPYAQGNMLLRGDCARIPILLGSCLDEGSGGGPGYVERVTERLGISAEPYPDSREGMVRLARDYWYARHYGWARIRSEELELPTWHYVFSRQDGERGAQHGDELPFAFRTMASAGIRRTPYEDGDQDLMETLSGYWENFIKAGDPNGSGLPYWPMKKAGVGHMNFDLETSMVDDDYIHENDPAICPSAYAWLKRRADGEIDG